MQETIRVLPNPFTFVDEDGEPMGACPADPEHAAGARMWIGAHLDPVRTRVLDTRPDGKKIRREAGDTRPFPQTTKWVFATEPVEIPQTAHYLDRVRSGDLIAADERTYRKAFGHTKGYLEPCAALDVECAAAIDDYVAAHGRQPAFAAKESAPEGETAVQASQLAVEAAPTESAPEMAPGGDS